MDANFRALGISRGASEADMKKAFKTKALQFHPDRNPRGAEMFKVINSSYEQLCVHYKKNGGIDRRGIFEDDPIPASGGYRQHQQPRSAGPTTTSAPLFTEEELFGARAMGSEYGMFGSSARNGGAVPAGGYKKGFRQRDRAGSESGGGGGSARTYSSFDPRHGVSEEKRNAAHGNRTAQSGYSAFTSAEDMSAFESQMRHFEEMERKKRDLHKGGGGGGADTQSTPPKYGRRSDSSMGDSPPAGGGGRRDSVGGTKKSSVEEEFVGRNAGPLPPSRPSMYSQSSFTNGQAPRSRSTAQGTTSKGTNDESDDPKARSQNVVSQRQMEDEWEFERQVQEANKRAEDAQEETMRRLRREQRERETQEEWDRTQAEMEQDKLSRTAAARTEELRKQLERRDRASAAREGGVGGDQRGASVSNSEIDEDDLFMYRDRGGMAASAVVDAGMVKTAKARRLIKEEKIGHMLPSPVAIEKMSLPELHILQESLNKMSADVLSLYHGRLQRSTHCLVCQVTKMDSRTVGLYKCDHASLCYTCSFTCAICPLCGAERKLMPEE